MLKKILLIFLTLVLPNCVFAFEPYLPKGSLVKVYVKKIYSTQGLEEGSRVYFIVPSDVWVLEKKAVEKGDIFEGYVSMLKLPVQGVNAAIKIDIDTIIKLNGEKRDIKGKVLFSGSDVFGGTLTNPASYNTTIHPRKVYGNHWGGSLQYVPSGEYEFGQHVYFGPRDNLLIEIGEDYYF